MITDFYKIDEVYKRYGYEVRTNFKDVRVYILPYGMYHGADIVKINDSIDTSKITKDLAQNGYSCIERIYSNIEEVENELFKGFFNVKSIRTKLSKKYDEFRTKQTKHLGNLIEYEYIDSPYEINTIEAENEEYINEECCGNILDDIMKILSNDGSFLIIIEAAAGFGKTCTAYEILNKLSDSQEKSPFFTELSRNREARIFKHVLLSEIDSEYESAIKSDLVKHEMKSGRIPLIIDGFDELLSKDQSMKSKRIEFEEVESMLTTIGELLENKAKVILTSRKTAIFSGKEFMQWLKDFDGKFNVIRLSIDSPKIENWLELEKCEAFKAKQIPLNFISNPVLLSYLRSIKMKDFDEFIQKADSIVDKYFDSMLNREITRQNLRLDVETQLKIFKKLAIFLTELDITSEDKEFIKDSIIDLNRKPLEASRKLYPKEITPSLNDLGDTLTNHALLDRVGTKTNNIGFINEFVFGTLVGLALIEGKFRGKYNEFSELIADSVLTAFEFQKEKEKYSLWELFTKNDFNFGKNFTLMIDLKLRKEILREFSDGMVFNFEFDDIKFSNNCKFKKYVFSNCKFNGCTFTTSSFSSTSFVTCTFNNCNVEFDSENYSHNMMFFGCNDFENDFLILFNKDAIVVPDFALNKNNEFIVMRKYFKVDGRTSKRKLLSQLNNEIIREFEADYLNIFREFERLRANGMFEIDGDVSCLSEKGIDYYNANLREEYGN